MARIMFVDDDDIIVLLTRTTLRRLGHEAHTFTDAKSALAAFSKAPASFELVICDVRLEDNSGFELARAIRALHPRARILMVSGAFDEQDVRRARESGALDLLPKSEVMTDLAGSLRRFLPG